MRVAIISYPAIVWSNVNQHLVAVPTGLTLHAGTYMSLLTDSVEHTSWALQEQLVFTFLFYDDSAVPATVASGSKLTLTGRDFAVQNTKAGQLVTGSLAAWHRFILDGDHHRAESCSILLLLEELGLKQLFNRYTKKASPDGLFTLKQR